MATPETFTISARDGYPLSALHLPAHGNPRGAIVFGSGTGFKKEFYLKFSTYLAQQGYGVLLFDYRGVAGSAPAKLKGFYARQFQWGQEDLGAAWDWMIQQYPTVPHIHMGHSMGGMISGMYDQPEKLHGYIFIASGSPNWRFITWPSRIMVWLLFHVMGPLSTRIMGYFPSPWFGLGQPLPAEVGLDWGRWSKSKTFLNKFFGKEIPVNHYEKVTAPIHAFLIEDDKLATVRGREQLLELFSQAPKKRHLIDQNMAQGRKVGHHGLFSSKHQESLWPIFTQTLEEIITTQKSPSL
ncbi:MAG: alpha/beta fold hydrolase [Bacteroidota bacterium]